MGNNTTPSERVFLLTLVAGTVSVAVVGISLGLSTAMILAGFAFIPFMIGMIAKPPLAVGFVFFCFFTNAQQVASLVHEFHILTELLFILIIVLLAKDIVHRRFPSEISGVFACLLVLNIAFVLFQISFGSERQFAVEIVKYGLFALAILILMRNPARLRGALVGIVLALAFMSGITVLQYMFELYHISFGGFGAATYHHIAGEVDHWRVDGPLTDPNFYAQVLLISLPFAMLGLGKNLSRGWQSICLIVVLFGLAALILTYSRGALVGLAMLAVAYSYGRWRLMMLAGSALALFLLMVDSSYLDRLAAAMSDIVALLHGEGYLQDVAISGRLSEMLLAFYLFIEHPMFGIGIGQYEGHYQDAARHFGLMARGADREAHSLLLELLAERGLVGTLIYLLTAGGALFCALRALRQGGGAAPIAHALLYALLAYTTTSLFLHEAFPMYLWLLFALCFAMPQMVPRPKSPRAREADLWTYEDEPKGDGHESH